MRERLYAVGAPAGHGRARAEGAGCPLGGSNHERVPSPVPAPLLRWKEGDTVTMRVANTLDEDASIHWHGILLPANMDGVPGLSFHGIRPGETYVYRFEVRQAPALGERRQEQKRQ